MSKRSQLKRTKHLSVYRAQVMHKLPMKINHHKVMKSIMPTPLLLIPVFLALGVYRFCFNFLINFFLFSLLTLYFAMFNKNNLNSIHFSIKKKFMNEILFFFVISVFQISHRLPLQEIRQDAETSVCMQDILSPMSIDKSLIENDGNVSLLTVDDQATDANSSALSTTSSKRFAAKDDLEKFFEVEDYRDDILVSI